MRGVSLIDVCWYTKVVLMGFIFRDRSITKEVEVERMDHENPGSRSDKEGVGRFRNPIERPLRRGM